MLVLSKPRFKHGSLQVSPDVLLLDWLRVSLLSALVLLDPHSVTTAHAASTRIAKASAGMWSKLRAGVSVMNLAKIVKQANQSHCSNKERNKLYGIVINVVNSFLLYGFIIKLALELVSIDK